MSKNWKKVTAIYLAIIIALGGCGKSNADNVNDPKEQRKNSNYVAEEGKYPSKGDLSLLYANEEEWLSDYDKVMEMYKGYDAFKGKLNNARDIYDYFNFAYFSEITTLQNKLGTYVNLLGVLDTTDPAYKRLSDKYNELMRTESEYNDFAEQEIFALSFEQRKEIFSDPVFGEDKRWLTRYLTEDFTPLTESEENIVSTLSKGLGYSGYIFDILNSIELPYPDITMPSGEEDILDEECYLDIVNNPDYSNEFKASAHRQYFSRHANFANTFAALLEENCNQTYADALLNGYDSAKEAALDEIELDTKVYDMLLDTCHNYLDQQQRYYILHAKGCDLTEQHMQDLYLIPSDYKRDRTSYDDAVDEVISSLTVLGDDYVDHFTKIITSGHVDVYPSDTKNTGASENKYGFEYLPWVTYNYQGYSEDISTIAHEMGHAVYDMYAIENQSPLYTDPPIFTHEVASTTNELLYYTYMINNAKDNDEKLYYLDNAISLFTATFFRQMMYSEFEDYMYETVEGGGSFDPEAMRSKWIELSEQYRGDSVKYYQEDGYYWAKINHFYRPYYVYQYAADIAYAASIVQRITSGDQDALDNYIGFLKLGNSKSPVELLNAAGIDPLSQKTYDDAMEFYIEMLDEYEKLIENR